MRLRSAFISTFVRQILVMGLGLISISMVSKVLGSASFGKYAVAVAVVAVGQAVFSFSAPAVIVHYYSKKIERSVLVGEGLVIVGGALSILFVILLVALYLGWLDLLGVDVVGVIVIFLLMTLQAFNSIFEAVLLGGRNYRLFNLLQMCVPSCFLVLVFLFLKPGDSWQKAILLSCIAAATVSPIYATFSLRSLGGISLEVCGGLFNTYLSYGLKIWAANLVTMLLYRAPLFIVEHMCSATDLGAFALANNFSEKVWVPGKAVATILFPERSSNGVNGGLKRTGVYRLVLGNMLLALLGMLALCLVFYFFESTFFGEGFYGLYWIALALTPGIVAWSGVNLFGAELAGLGMSGSNFKVSVIAFLFSVTVCIFGANFGAVGVALGVSFGYLIGLVASYLSYGHALAEATK